MYWQPGSVVGTSQHLSRPLKSCHNRQMMGIYVLNKQQNLPALILKRMDGWIYCPLAVSDSHRPPFVLLRKQGHNTSERSSAGRQVTHSIVAGSVDNVNLLEVPVQEMSTDGQDVTATAIILLHCHRLGQTGAWGWCTAVETRRRKKMPSNFPKDKQDTHSKKGQLSKWELKYMYSG